MQLQTEATAEKLIAEEPETVIWATGAEPLAQEQQSGSSALTLQDALFDPDALGDRVLMVDHLGGWSVVAVVTTATGSDAARPAPSN